jgi:hypothetical protein
MLRVLGRLVLCGLALLVVPMNMTAGTSLIQGDYVEARSAEVYTGFCVANSEVGLVGDQAILAWKIKVGSWKGVPLDGLNVVAVVKAKSTLGDPYHDPYPAKTVLIVDRRANVEQQTALEAFAQSMAKDLLENVVKVETASITVEIGEGVEHGRAKLAAGSEVVIETRPIGEKDHLCGNEDVYYAPLAPMVHAMPVLTMKNQFAGSGLGVTWRLNDKRSSFVGQFLYQAPTALISLNR